MKLLADLNNERFLSEAFEPEHNGRLVRSARLLRNIYFGLFLGGAFCIMVTALINALLLCILSLGLATLSLVMMSRHGTQLHFLRTIQLRKNTDTTDGEPSITE